MEFHNSQMRVSVVVRPWELKGVESVDFLEAEGAHTRVEVRGNRLLRVLPRIDHALAQEWLSDVGRFGHDLLQFQRLRSSTIDGCSKSALRSRRLIFLFPPLRPRRFVRTMFNFPGGPRGPGGSRQQNRSTSQELSKTQQRNATSATCRPIDFTSEAKAKAPARADVIIDHDRSGGELNSELPSSAEFNRRQVIMDESRTLLGMKGHSGMVMEHTSDVTPHQGPVEVKTVTKDGISRIVITGDKVLDTNVKNATAGGKVLIKPFTTAEQLPSGESTVKVADQLMNGTKGEQRTTQAVYVAEEGKNFAFGKAREFPDEVGKGVAKNLRETMGDPQKTPLVKSADGPLEYLDLQSESKRAELSLLAKNGKTPSGDGKNE